MKLQNAGKGLVAPESGVAARDAGHPALPPVGEDGRVSVYDFNCRLRFWGMTSSSSRQACYLKSFVASPSDRQNKPTVD